MLQRPSIPIVRQKALKKYFVKKEERERERGREDWDQ
jgi:hypothetical protein